MAYNNNLSKEEQKRLAQEKVEKAFAKITSDAVSIFDKDSLPKFLEFLAKFHYFDIYNLILLYKQRPSATFVASFKTWERISTNHWHDPSRPIFASSQKGQGIGILAPYILKKKITDATDLRSAAIGSRIVSYFDYHIVFVFDREQTNGIPAPAVEWQLSKSKIDAEAAYSAMKAIATFDIVFSADEHFRGNFVFEKGDKSNNRRDVLVLNAKYRFDHFTLCNFILRIFVVQSLEKMGVKGSPDEFEKIVECVSFVLASYFGLSTNEYIFFFARTWANDSQSMLAILNTIRQASHLLIEDIESEMIDYKEQFGDNDDIYVMDDDIFEFESLSLFDINSF